MSRDPSLPDFQNPPVAEVVLSIQFEPISSMRSVHYGLLWQKFRDEYPKFEEHAPLGSAIEKFGEPDQTPEFRIEMTNAPTVPRIWFLNNEGTQLIQIQQDRFTHNWRKAGPEESYPRYERISESFKREVEIFQRFLMDENLENLRIIQCEVTYVNHIESKEIPNIHESVKNIVTVVSNDYSDDFLKTPENIEIGMRYIISDRENEPMGRLHISLNPKFRLSDLSPLIVLTLTARGQPRSTDLADSIEFMDVGREWIVRGFASVTTRKMHGLWRRIDESL